MGRFIAIVAITFGSLVGVAQAAPDETAHDGRVAKKADAKQVPPLFGGSLAVTTALGRGTFLAEPEHEPYLNLLITLKPKVRLDRVRKISLGLRLDVSSNLVEPASSSSTRPNQVLLGDLALNGTWDDFVTLDAASLSWSGSLALVFPTSLLSQHVTKVVGLQAEVTTTFTPVKPLSVSWAIGATKNFNRYDSATLSDDDFTISPKVRAGGAEGVSEGLTATGAGVTEWGLSNSLSVEVTFIEPLSLLVDFTLVNAWTYKSFPVDERSSPYATPGRGQSDMIYGTLELTYAPIDFFSVSLGTVVEQTPLQLDNDGLRFPFWDTTNGAANRQTFYVTLTGSL